jgi:hypothetical protein
MVTLPHDNRSSGTRSAGLTAGIEKLSQSAPLALFLLAAGILVFARQYLNPSISGPPHGADLGNDLAYLGIFRTELLDSGRLLTWWSVSKDGLPLLGHPLSQVFYAPLTLPALAFGTETGIRITYVFSLLLAGSGMYLLARMLGPRPIIAAWAGFIFAVGGGIGARIHAGHVEKVLAMPLIPLVLAGALMTGRAETNRTTIFWGVLTGLITGLTFLAGGSYVLLYLVVSVPLVLLVVKAGQGLRDSWWSLILCLSAWAAGLLLGTAGKLVASAAILPDTIRQIHPYVGGQDAYWAAVHLAVPFFRYTTHPWGWWEYSSFIGLIPLALGALAVLAVVVAALRWSPLSGLVTTARREITALAAVVLLAALWLANGFWYSPVHWAYEVLPRLDSFRVPSRALMVAGPASLALAAVALESSLRLPSRERLTRWAVPAAIVLLVAGLVGVWSVNVSWTATINRVYNAAPGLESLQSSEEGYMVAGVVMAVVLIVLAAIVVRWSASGQSRPGLVIAAAVSILAITGLADVAHATKDLPTAGDVPAVAPVLRVLDLIQEQDQGPFLMDIGKFGFTDTTAVRLALAERGIPVAKSVAPPLSPKFEAEHQLIGDAERIRYFIGTDEHQPLSEGTWRTFIEDGSILSWINDDAQGDSWLVNGSNVTPLDVLSYSPGRFTVEADGAAGSVLVVPANAFDGWKVSIDGGQEISAINFDGYASVQTSPGRHTYEFVYRAPVLPLIIVLSILPWLALLGIGVWAAASLVRKPGGLSMAP